MKGLSEDLKKNENLLNAVLCSLINLCSKKTHQIEKFSTEVNYLKML